MRKLLSLLAVLLLLPIAPCAAKDAPISRTAQEDDIREAVFRYQFNHNASGLQQNAKIYFLSLSRKKDPEDRFLKRFKDLPKAVKKASEAEASALEGVKDRKTGESGLIFFVGRIKWVKDVQVEVGGGYYENGLSASSNTYYVVKKNNKWVVIKDKMHEIS